MFGSLLERLGLGRRGPLGRMPVRRRVIMEGQRPDIGMARARQLKLREIR